MLISRTWTSAGALLLLSLISCSAEGEQQGQANAMAPAHRPQPSYQETKRRSPSATKSLEVGPFALGMHVRDVNAISPVERIGEFQFDAHHEGAKYNFEVTPMGRVYRISSEQPLGRFVEDEQFRSTLLKKLTEKYGQPNSVNGSDFGWELFETVRSHNPGPNPFKTMWMSSTVSDSAGEKSLDITLIDFKILWADQAIANTPARAAAEKAVNAN